MEALCVARGIRMQFRWRCWSRGSTEREKEKRRDRTFRKLKTCLCAVFPGVMVRLTFAITVE